MKATVKKWGNSAAVRIPAAVLQASRLRLDDDVEVRGEEGRVVIEPLQVKTYRLKDLLKGITGKNLHEPIEFGAPEGREIW
jgi:antitoxin MazE